MSEQTSDLALLMKKITKWYRFLPSTYADLAGMNQEQKLRFAIKHSILHMNKSVGALAREVEEGDHGGEMKAEQLRVATAKMLINTLKLADVLGLSATDLISLVPQVMKR